MKRIYIMILCGLIAYLPAVFGQISQGGEPPSFSEGLPEADVQLMVMRTVSQKEIDDLEQEDIKSEHEMMRIAVTHPVQYNLENTGTWQTLRNGDKLWRLRIKCPSALATTLVFDDFFLPLGSKLFLYNKDRSQVLGAYTSLNNNKAYNFATEITLGDEVTLEYVEPYSVIGQGHIGISQIGHVYKGVPENSLSENSALMGCHVDIRCAEGDGYQNRKKGVARLLMNGSGWCSGSLLNRSNNDFAPYLLTADHCLGSGDAISNPNLTIVCYWNYEATTCGGGTNTSTSLTTSGAVIKANDNTSSSDFAILELNSNPAASYDVYYNGWTRNIPGAGGVGVHHPGGSPKKVSTYNVVPDGTCGGSRYYKVDWISTANGFGVTEGGSSGSSLFNSTGHSLGQLFGIFGSCGTNGNCPSPSTDDSQYGKISYSWDNNGATDNRRKLQPWLSPSNSTLMEYEGGYACINTVNLTGVLRNAGHNAVTTLTSNGTVASGERIFMNAGTSITLTDGFEAKDGSLVEGKIKSCSVPAPFIANVHQYKEPVNERNERLDSPSLEALTMNAFPNPFISDVKINFSLPTDMSVTIQVFDVMGRLIDSPILSTQMAKGHHFIDIDGSTWASGTYRVLLHAGTTTKNIKLILVK